MGPRLMRKLSLSGVLAIVAVVALVPAVGNAQDTGPPPDGDGSGQPGDGSGGGGSGAYSGNDRGGPGSIPGSSGAGYLVSGSQAIGLDPATAQLIDSSRVDDVATSVGRWDVSAGGHLSYDYPLQFAPGRAGLEPQLSVVHSQGARSGLMGVGVYLRGLPSIVRVIASGQGRDYGSDDKFAFASEGWEQSPDANGTLIKVPGANEFRTQRESWARFSAYGQCGAGPCYWVLEDGQGRKHYYGASGAAAYTSPDAVDWEPIPAHATTSRGIHRWHLARIEDVFGNTLVVDYRASVPVRTPARISYTGHPERPAVFQVNFGYEPRPDRVAGGLVERLATVELKSHETRLRGYRFGYCASCTTSKLETITESGATWQDSLPATRFGWASAQAPSFSPPEPLNRTLPYEAYRGAATHLADVTGDGIADIIRVTFGVRWPQPQPGAPTPPKANLVYVVPGHHRLGATTPIQLTTPYAQTGEGNTTIEEGSSPHLWTSHVGELNGDGHADVLLSYVDGEGGFIHRGVYGHATSLGQSDAISGRHAVDFRAVSIPAELGGKAKWPSHWMTSLVDINRDGTHEVVMTAPCSGEFVAGPLESLPELTPKKAPDQPRGASCEDGRPAAVRFSDVNGDGVEDLVVAYAHAEGLGVGVALGEDTSFGPMSFVTHAEDFRVDAARRIGFDAVVGDIDGDERADVVFVHYGSAGRIVKAVFGTPGGIGLEFKSLHDDRSLPQPFRFHADAEGRCGLSVPGYQADDGTAGVCEDKGWTHTLGDIDGDDVAELVSTYRGGFGRHTIAGFLRGVGVGLHLEVLPAVDNDLASGWLSNQDDDPVALSSFGARPGDIYVDPWHHLGLDLDGDGRTELVTVRASNVGAYPAPDGKSTSLEITSAPLGESIGPFREIFRTNDAWTIQPPFRMATMSSTLDRVVSEWIDRPPNVVLVGDVTGDGVLDIVIASEELVKVARGIATRPALLESVSNGYGTETEVDYQLPFTTSDSGVPVIGQPVMPDKSTCSGDLLGGCGLHSLVRRHLVATVRERHGQGVEQTTTFEYYNGRYQKGAFGVARDLGFETVIRRSTRGLTSITTYNQREPFERLPKSVELYEGGLEAWNRVARDDFTYEHVVTSLGTRITRTTQHDRESREAGLVAGLGSTRYAYGAYGEPTSTVQCADGQCERTRIAYGHDPQRWLIRRVVGRHVESTDAGSMTSPPIATGAPTWTTMEAERFHFAQGPTSVAEASWVYAIERLLCDDASACSCDDIATCGGVGRRWVPIQHNRAPDAYGNLTSARDALGLETKYVWDDLQRAQLQRTERLVRKSAGAAVLLAETRQYDEAGRPWRVISRGGEVTEVYYDSFGRVEESVGPGPRRVKFSYHETGDPTRQYLQILTATEQLPGAGVDVGIWERRYYDGAGRVYRVERGGHDCQSVIRTRREEWALGYGSRRYAITAPHYAHELPAEVHVLVDARDRPWMVLRANPGEPQRVVSQTFRRGGVVEVEDADGRLTKHYVDSRERLYRYEDGLGRPVQREYDGAGRVVRVDLPSDALEAYVYDTFGRLTEAFENRRGSTVYEYDDGSRLRTERLSSGEVLRREYDDVGRTLTEAWDDEVKIRYQYDDCASPTCDRGIGRLTSVEDESGLTSFSYNDVGLVRARAFQPAGHIARFVEWYEYDKLGRAIRLGTPSGNIHDFVYDASGTLSGLFINGLHVARWSDMDASGRARVKQVNAAEARMLYDADGYLHSLTTRLPGGLPIQDTEYTYFPSKALESITDRRPASARIVGTRDTSESQSFTYDGAAQLWSFTASGVTTTYDYDEDANLQKNGDFRIWTGHPFDVLVEQSTPMGDVEVERRTSDVRGRLVRRVVGPQVYEYSYDARDQLRRVTRGGIEIFRAVYDFTGRKVGEDSVDDAGVRRVTLRPMASYELRSASNTTGHTAVEYVSGAGVGRVAVLESHVNTSLWYTVPSPSAALPSSRSYDPRLWWLVALLAGLGAALLATPRIRLSPRGRRVGAAGVALAASSILLAPTYIDFTVQVPPPPVVVELDHQPITVTIDDDRPLDLGTRVSPQVCANLDEDAIVAAQPAMSWANNLAPPSSANQQITNARFLWPNHIGSVAVTTNEAGLVTSRLVYEPYGRIVASSSVDATHQQFRFHGKEQSDATGLVDFGARHYDPLVGQFITSDDRAPVGGLGVTSMNRHAFCLNSPVVYTDPTGHEPAEPTNAVAETDSLEFATWDQVKQAVSGTSELLETKGGDLVGSLMKGMSPERVASVPEQVPRYGDQNIPREIGVLGAREAQYQLLGGVIGKVARLGAARRSGGAESNRLGKLGEEVLSWFAHVKPQVPYTTAGMRERIADGISAAYRTLIEVKNVKYQHYSTQLKDALAEAKRRGYRLLLIVRKDTKLAKPLEKAERDGEIDIIRLLPGDEP